MKSMKFMLVALVCLLVSTVSYADGRVIPVTQLPEGAKTFVATHFPGKKIFYAQKDGRKYEVRLDDGTEIDFDRKGVWDKVDCHDFQAVPATIDMVTVAERMVDCHDFKAVPATIIPAPIAAYVQTNFSTFFITKIDKERYGYSIELSNDIELKFDKLGNLIGVDD